MAPLFPVVLPAAQMRLVTQFTRLAVDAQMVVGLRVAGMMGMIAQSPGEPIRMISEKHEALSESVMAMASAGWRGHSPERLLSAGMRPYGKRTRANSRRLSVSRAT